MKGLLLYRRTQLLCAAVLVGYVFIANAMKPPGQIEFFPFFNWSLFSVSSDRKLDVTLILRSVNDGPVDPPRYYYDLKETFEAARTRNPRLMKLLDKWAYSLRTGDAATADQLRAVVENSFMQEVRTAQYDLALLSYNPIRRLRDGTVDSIEIIGSFEKGAQ